MVKTLNKGYAATKPTNPLLAQIEKDSRTVDTAENRRKRLYATIKAFKKYDYI